ncbi:MAG TPA: nucleotidyltransferase family protein [Casimicrobiaceae bacterium]
MTRLATAMILAAGRGERMRPLSDHTPKPLLLAGGKPLIVWQIEALARAGFRDIVVNAAHGAAQLVGALGNGAAFGVRIAWSREAEPLETAGGIATASPLLAPGPALIVSGDIWTRFEYAALRARIDAIAEGSAPRVHLVMVPNPPYHPTGDFCLDADRVGLEGPARLTFGNIGVYDTALFRGLPRGVKIRMLPLYHEWIGRRLVSGERYEGPWANVGTPADLAALDAALAASADLVCTTAPRTS